MPKVKQTEPKAKIKSQVSFWTGANLHRRFKKACTNKGLKQGECLAMLMAIFATYADKI